MGEQGFEVTPNAVAVTLMVALVMPSGIRLNAEYVVPPLGVHSGGNVQLYTTLVTPSRYDTGVSLARKFTGLVLPQTRYCLLVVMGHGLGRTLVMFRFFGLLHEERQPEVPKPFTDTVHPVVAEVVTVMLPVVAVPGGEARFQP